MSKTLVDSTLKRMKKDELIDYIRVLEYNYCTLLEAVVNQYDGFQRVLNKLIIERDEDDAKI